MPTPICLRLLRHWVRLAFSLARESTGRSIAARIAMMAITTSSSIRVKPRVRSRRRSGSALLESFLIVVVIAGESGCRQQGTAESEENVVRVLGELEAVWL